jgi:hypothetical protein
MLRAVFVNMAAAPSDALQVVPRLATQLASHYSTLHAVNLEIAVCHMQQASSPFVSQGVAALLLHNLQQQHLLLTR